MSTDKTVNQPWKAIRSFFVFWKDFLVGDSPVLALGVLIILGVAYVLRGSSNLASGIAIILVLALMAYTIWQKTKTKRRPTTKRQEHRICKMTMKRQIIIFVTDIRSSVKIDLCQILLTTCHRIFNRRNHEKLR